MIRSVKPRHVAIAPTFAKGANVWARGRLNYSDRGVGFDIDERRFAQSR